LTEKGKKQTIEIMCGIFAVSGSSSEAGKKVLKGLKKLEYRGYDSWGVAIREKTTQQIQRIRDVGKISQVEKDFLPSYEAIGHSRWATHGGVTIQNAHPHTAGRVTLVHNGIFENYENYKQEYKKTHQFESETDTEVIAKMLDEFYAAGLSPQESIQKAFQKIAGRFAIVVFFENVPGIFAARRGSSLILGRSDTQTFIASDIPAFLEDTNQVNYLDDNEMVHVVGTEVQFFSAETGERKEKRTIEVGWKNEDAQKGEFLHFMIKEIFDQKETILRAINHSDEDLLKAVSLLKSSNGTYLVACGTAHKVAMTAEYFFSQIAGRKVNVVPASEIPSFERFIHEKTCVMAISQSGETADVLEIFERSQKKGASLLALTNVESSSMARMATVHLSINAGPERAVASTKAATAQMALCLLLAFVEQGKINEGRQILSLVSANINDMLNPRYTELIASIAEKIKHHDNLFIIGRNALYPMALESSIKIQEVSYIHAQGFAAGELKHGHIALITKGTPCIVLGDDSETISNATELRARGAEIIGIAPERKTIFNDWIRVPDCASAQCIASIIPMQILAYHLAVLRGHDPDMPRNLAKSVTVK